MSDRKPWHVLADCQNCVWDFQQHDLEDKQRRSDKSVRELIREEAETHTDVTGHEVRYANMEPERSET